MVEVRIETLGAERFVRGFNRFEAEMRDLREPFGVIAEDFAETAERNFGAVGTPEKWAPLSPEYAKWKAKVRPGRQILVFDGKMYESLRGVRTGFGPDTVRDIQAQRAEFGTTVPYAIFHQTGTRKMPRRKPVQLTDQDKRRWARVIHEWAVKGLEWVESTRARM